MLEKLKQYGFEPAARIFVDTEANRVTFEMLDDRFSVCAGMVYAWTVGDEVLYIGKAGKGIKKRFGEHKNGWRGASGTGYEKGKLIRSLGGEIIAYGRISDQTGIRVNLFGEEMELDQSIESLEEEFLIKKLQPVWNVNGK